MAFKVLYHEDALADLEAIFERSRDKHPETTEQFAKDLFNHIDLLGAFPNFGAPVRGRPGVRRLLHSPLIIYYEVDEIRGCVEILHFWHGSRRAPFQ